MRKTILALRKRERAVSCEDFVELAKAADTRVARAYCIPRQNLHVDFEREQVGNVSLIIVPRTEVPAADVPNLLVSVKDYLEPRRLLTTHVHVFEPQYLPVDVQATVVRLPDGVDINIKRDVVNATKDFLAPLKADDTGWPFGRNIFVSEIYELLDNLSGMDYITSVSLDTLDANRLIREDGELVEVEVKPYELVTAQIDTASVIVQPT